MNSIDVKRDSLRRRLVNAVSRLSQGDDVDLITALNDVAAAVSSAVSLDEVLDIIVQRAKRITNTEKAVLILTQDHSPDLDSDTLVVKGSRDEHPESWWADEIKAVAPQIFETGRVYLGLSEENDAWLMCAPIRVQDRPIGMLSAINSRTHKFSRQQVDFLAILGAFAASAIENARLAEESRYVLLASERDRIAREMHDGISQSLFGVALGLEVCRKQVFRDPNGVSERLSELQEQVDLSRSELRRFIYDLRPIKLQELGLIGAIEFWVHEVSAGRKLQTSVVVNGTTRSLRPATEACLYRVAKEAIGNAVRHSGATWLEARLIFGPDTVTLQIHDNGCGFDAAEMARRDPDAGIGLPSIAHRVTSEGGRLDINSVPGQGTRIDVTVAG
ncbi:MAG: GAF domain-containing sensor histidine kinase [Coriobacteriia bacterium]